MSVRGYCQISMKCKIAVAAGKGEHHAMADSGRQIQVRLQYISHEDDRFCWIIHGQIETQHGTVSRTISANQSASSLRQVRRW